MQALIRGSLRFPLLALAALTALALGCGGDDGGASGEGGERGVRTCNHRLPVEERSVVVQHLPRHGDSEITVGLLDDQGVPEVGRVTFVGEMVFVMAMAFELAGVGVEVAGLPEEIEADVGQRHVLLEFGGVGEPLGESVAEDEGSVGLPQDVREEIGRHHM